MDRWLMESLPLVEGFVLAIVLALLVTIGRLCRCGDTGK